MPTKVAVASCCRLEAFPVQRVWADILDEDPDYLLLLGDQVYMDYGIFGSEPNRSPSKLSDAEFKKKMEAKYRDQWEEPHFKALLDAVRDKRREGEPPRVMATWDDHDFAWDNSRGADPKHGVPATKRKISMEIFKKYLGDPGGDSSEIYFSVDTPFARIIFIDNRSYMQVPGPNAELLGEQQWKFLEEKLREPEGEIRPTLICGGLTLTHGTERWQLYPTEYKRLRTIIEESGRRIIFLGGDIHEVKFEPPNASRPCYELVSSGIAVNYLGLSGSADDCHNWAMLVFDGSMIEVRLHHDTYFRKGEEIWQLDILAWVANQIKSTCA